MCARLAIKLLWDLEVERARARLVFLARAGETSQARLGSSRQFEFKLIARSSRLANLSLSSWLARLVSPIWSYLSRLVLRAKKRDQNLPKIWLVWLIFPKYYIMHNLLDYLYSFCEVVYIFEQPETMGCLSILIVIRSFLPNSREKCQYIISSKTCKIHVKNWFQ